MLMGWMSWRTMQLAFSSDAGTALLLRGYAGGRRFRLVGAGPTALAQTRPEGLRACSGWGSGWPVFGPSDFPAAGHGCFFTPTTPPLASGTEYSFQSTTPITLHHVIRIPKNYTHIGYSALIQHDHLIALKCSAHRWRLESTTFTPSSSTPICTHHLPHNSSTELSHGHESTTHNNPLPSPQLNSPLTLPHTPPVSPPYPTCHKATRQRWR